MQVQKYLAAAIKHPSLFLYSFSHPRFSQLLERYAELEKEAQRNSFRGYDGAPVIMKEGFALCLIPNDSLSASYFVNRDWEENVTRLLKQIVKPEMTCVDVGANIGYFSVLMAKLVGSSGKVYAFEPEPTNCEFLSRNVELNKCENLVIERLAVSDKIGPATLHIDEENRGSHQLRQVHDGQKSVEVKTTTLDEYLEGIEVDVIKIDAEGCEPAILKGGKRVLGSAQSPQVIIEYAPKHMREMGFEPQEFIETVTEYGLEARIITDKGLEPRQLPADVKEHLDVYLANAFRDPLRDRTAREEQ